MRCINRKRRRSRNRLNFSRNSFGFSRRKLRFRKRNGSWLKKAAIALAAVVLVGTGVGLGYFLLNNPLASYEKEAYEDSVYQAALYAEDLCVITDDVAYDKFQSNNEFHAVSLMDVTEKDVLLAEHMHDKIFPASTTKIMTLYLALTHGNLNDTVTVSENAVSVPLDSSRAGFRAGDQLTLEQLLYSLMLPSGNDSAIAVAEHISGSVEAFVDLMNAEAVKMGATNTHFVTPHGYQHEEHYTTAYDLYLIFSKCIENEDFRKIVSTDKYSCNVTQKDGMLRAMDWEQSNQFVNGARKVPEGVTVIGGKTGTTDEAGACLILLSEASDSKPYISIIMGAETRSVLYDNMTSLLSTISN